MSRRKDTITTDEINSIFRTINHLLLAPHRDRHKALIIRRAYYDALFIDSTNTLEGRTCLPENKRELRERFETATGQAHEIVDKMPQGADRESFLMALYNIQNYYEIRHEPLRAAND